MIKGLNPGQLDLRISLEKLVIVKNAIGEKTETWVAYKTTMAKKARRGGSESIEGRQAVAIAATEYIVRYDGNIVETMRLKEGGASDYSYLTSVSQWKRERYTQFTAQVRDNQ